MTVKPESETEPTSPHKTRDHLAVLNRKDFEIGDYTYGHPKVRAFDRTTKLKIGKFCSIASGVQILLGGNHRPDWITTFPFTAFFDVWPEAKGISGHPSSKGDVIIGNDVWIGTHSTILSGVNIGDGAVIGACSVVTQNVPPYGIVAGNPAKFIKKRFPDEVIKKLLEIAWWNWPEEKIREALPLFLTNNYSAVLAKYQTLPESRLQPQADVQEST